MGSDKSKQKSKHKDKSSSKNDQNNDDVRYIWWAAFALVTLFAFGTRFYKISEPDHVWYGYSFDLMLT